MIKDNIYIYTFYRFKNLIEVRSLKIKLDKYLKNKLILGTVLLANEGVNGTISGTKKDLNEFINFIKQNLKIRKLSIKISQNKFIPFYRLKIRLKKEIVTIGDKTIKPEKITGKHIDPKNWDKIINNKKYMIIDTRNTYEVSIGSFKNAINPKTKSFKEFPKFIEKLNIKKHQPIAMFCTGGIRCEKASSYLLKNGYKDISQLDGGILNYLEVKKKDKSISWQGECFVFDNRVAINNKLDKGSYEQCYGCRHPITKQDMKLKSYKKGATCKYCISLKSKMKIQSSSTRQYQIDIAEKNNTKHSFRKIYTTK
ncbi:rhodanese-related sulfurtransferase [Pelagibacterales bacterium]|nr:rhodanese-related sulfurtransferase [Pelagibacterales bacterium]